jgi:hypothetical protein
MDNYIISIVWDWPKNENPLPGVMRKDILLETHQKWYGPTIRSPMGRLMGSVWPTPKPLPVRFLPAKHWTNKSVIRCYKPQQVHIFSAANASESSDGAAIVAPQEFHNSCSIYMCRVLCPAKPWVINLSHFGMLPMVPQKGACLLWVRW